MSQTLAGFVVITETWRSDDLILAIAKIPEKYDTILEVGLYWTLKTITVNGKTYRLKYVICADLKFINIIMGLGACSSDYSCPW